MPGPDKEGQVFQAFGIDAAKVRAIIAKEDEAKEAVKEAGRYLEDFATQTKFPINISVKRAGKVNFGDKLTVDLNDYANPYSEKPSSAKSCLDALAKTLKDNWILTDVSVQNDIHHLTACAARAIGQPPAVEKNVIKEARSRYEEREHNDIVLEFQCVLDAYQKKGYSKTELQNCFKQAVKQQFQDKSVSHTAH